MAEGDTKLYVNDREAALARAFLKDLAGESNANGKPIGSLDDAAGPDGKYSQAELDQLAENLVNSINAAIPDVLEEQAKGKFAVKKEYGLKSNAETELRELITKSGADTPDDLMKVLKAAKFNVPNPHPGDLNNKEVVGLHSFLSSMRDYGSQPISVIYSPQTVRALDAIGHSLGGPMASMFFGNRGSLQDSNVNQDTTASLEKAFDVLHRGNVGDLAELWGEKLPTVKDANGKDVWDQSQVELWRGPNNSDAAMRGLFNGQDVEFNGTLNPELDHNFSKPYEAWPGSKITTNGGPQNFDNLITQGLVNSGAISFETPDARIAFNNFATIQILGSEADPEVTSSREFAKRITEEFKGGKNGVHVNTHYDAPTGPSGVVPNTAGYVPPASGAPASAAPAIEPVKVEMAAPSSFGRGDVGGGASAYVSPMKSAAAGLNFGATIEVADMKGLPFTDLDSALSGDPGTTEIMRHREMVVSDDGTVHFEDSEMITAYDLGQNNIQQITPVIGGDGSVDAFFVSQKPWENGAYQEGMGDGFFIDADVFDREALKGEQPELYAQLKLASDEPVIAQSPVVGAPAANLGASPS